MFTGTVRTCVYYTWCSVWHYVYDAGLAPTITEWDHLSIIRQALWKRSLTSMCVVHIVHTSWVVQLTCCGCVHTIDHHSSMAASQGALSQYSWSWLLVFMVLLNCFIQTSGETSTVAHMYSREDTHLMQSQPLKTYCQHCLVVASVLNTYIYSEGNLYYHSAPAWLLEQGVLTIVGSVFL